MAAPVWVLSVDLRTKTATFQTGLADAAKSARGSFQEIKDSAREMGDGVGEASARTGYSMMEARHGVMLLGEEFGVHLPRGITAFIVSLGPVGAAMEAAFPFLAIILGATLLYEHLTKLHDGADKLASAQDGVALATDKAFASMGDRILAAGVQLDELRGDHLAALKKELELVDHASLKDLGGEFEHLSSAVDALFKQLGHGFLSSFLTDVSGVQHAAEQFKAQYLQDLATGNGKGASDLLTGTLKSAKASLEGLFASGQTEASKTVQAQQQFISMLETQVALQGQANTLSREQKEVKTEREGQREEAEQQKIAAAQQRGLEHRIQLEREYDKKRDEALNKGMEERVKEGELEAQATMAVNKEIFEQEKERLRIAEELGKEEAEHIRKMAGLSLHAEEEQTKESIKLHKRRSDEVLAEQIAGENADYAAQMRAYQTQLASLDKYGKDYEVNIKQIQDREAELTKAHENKITDIKAKAEEERNAKILSAENKMRDEIASGMTQVLMRHESFAKMITSLGDQVATGMIENALKSMMALDMDKEKQAAHAARMAFDAGWHFPFPANIVMAPVLGAMAFASSMAFEEGGIVPGVEKGDVVNARLTPGEGIIPERVMTGISNAAKHGDVSEGGGEVHIHHSPTYHLHMIDATGVDKMLEQHSDAFTNHVGNELRKRNM